MTKILIIGFGSIGKRHMRNILSKKNMQVIICTKRNDFKNNEKNVKIVKTIDEGIAERPDIAFVTNERYPKKRFLHFFFLFFLLLSEDENNF